MTEQRQELKETIIELRDNDGTGTQQEVCKFLVNLMDLLVKQMQEPCEDCISRQAVLGILKDKWNMFSDANDAMQESIETIEAFPPVTPQPKTGHWIQISPQDIYECSECGQNVMTSDICAYKFCHGCGAKMV